MVEHHPSDPAADPDASDAPPPPRLFDLTDEWQEVPEGVVLPNGAEVRMNLSTGVNEARLLPADAARMEPGG